MAPAHSKTSNNDNGNTPREDVLLPLIPLPPTELMATNSVVYHLLSIPADVTSTKYKVTARIIDGTEDIRTLIHWSKDIDKILTGLNLRQNDQFDQTITICQSMMRTRVITCFNREIRKLKTLRMHALAQAAYDADGGDAAAKQTAKDQVLALGWQHANNNQFVMIRMALNNTLKEMMPKKVLARCKRHLRRHCRKPKDMRVREYVQLVHNMNNEEFPCLPPFAANQQLQDDEILDVVLFGTPKSWEREMDKQGFDPFSTDLNQVVAKLEDIEMAEGFDANAVKVTPKKDKKKAKPGNKKSGSGNNNNQNDNGKKHCMFHGWGSHTTEECEHLKKQVKKLKAEKSGNDSSKDNKKSGDWKKKADNAKGQDHFVTFMNQTVEKAVKQAVKSNKRKSDDDSSGSLAAFDGMDISDFDYEKMERMIIEDNGDITI